ncbi:unnamed protein product [Pedinophyceae sp. YPF-701]|nr:unnamed protein product [Pedinophyceae sp. YPF-701]
MADKATLAEILALVRGLDAKVTALEARLSSGGAPAAAPGRSSTGATRAGPAGGGPTTSGGSPLAALRSDVIPLVSELERAANAVQGKDAEGVRKATALLASGYRALPGVLARAKPATPAALQDAVAPISSCIQDLNKLADDRRSPAYHHVKAASEAIGALAFVAYAGPGCGMEQPPQHAESALQSASFWITKAVMDSGRDAAHLAWGEAVKALGAALKAHLARHQPVGPEWDASGAAEAPAAPAAAVKAPAKKAGGAPPPPPPPPPTVAALNAGIGGGGAGPSGGGGGGGGGSAEQLFAEIRKGAQLRHVTKDMKAQGKGGAVPAGGKPPPPPPSVPAPRGGVAGGAGVARGPPRTELEGGQRWVVENYVGGDGGNGQPITIKEADKRHSVCIRSVTNTTVVIHGKINNLTLESCRKVGVLFQGAIASVEALHCAEVELESKGPVAGYAIEQCDGCTIYMSRACGSDAQVVTSLSTQVNVVLLPSDDAADPLELPVPEQFVSRLEGSKLQTGPVEHAGA